MHPSLRTFLDLLTRENEIITVKAEVDPYLELAEIHRRVISEGGPALLFERVKGSRYPVVTNLFGTERRIDLAFGPKPEAFVRELLTLPNRSCRQTRLNSGNTVRLRSSFLQLGTRNTSRAPVTQVVDRPARLDRVAGADHLAGRWWAIHHLPLVYTENPVTKKHNLGIYRMQVYDAHFDRVCTGRFRRAVGFITTKQNVWPVVAGHSVSRWPTGVDSRGDRSAP